MSNLKLGRKLYGPCKHSIVLHNNTDYFKQKKMKIFATTVKIWKRQQGPDQNKEQNNNKC